MIVTDPDQLRELSAVWKGAGHIASAPAAAIARVVPVPPDERRKLVDQYDFGQAIIMAVAATDLGIGHGSFFSR